MKNCGDISNAILKRANKNKNNHSVFDNLQLVLININVTTNVKINTAIENILSYINVHKNHSQVQAIHFGDNCNGAITDDTHTIHKILNISDQITFHTHISYFFLIIAVNVAAISGKLVPAAIIVAQIAHSDTHNTVATYTAASTTKSEDMTSNPILASNLVVFNNIQFFNSFQFFFFLANIEIANNITITAINILEYDENHQSIWNQFSAFTVIIDSKNIPANKSKKFLIFGSSFTSHSASSTGSFLIHKYQLYHTNNANNVAHSRRATCWSQRNTNNNVVTNTKNSQSLLTIFFWIKIGATTALNHKINHRLNIFDQTIFPTDKDPLPFKADIADKNNSGADVQIAKIVSQINNGDSLKIFAILTLEFINLSAANQSNTNHTINKTIANIIFVFYK